MTARQTDYIRLQQYSIWTTTTINRLSYLLSDHIYRKLFLNKQNEQNRQTEAFEGCCFEITSDIDCIVVINHTFGKKPFKREEPFKKKSVTGLHRLKTTNVNVTFFWQRQIQIRFQFRSGSTCQKIANTSRELHGWLTDNQLEPDCYKSLTSANM